MSTVDAIIEKVTDIKKLLEEKLANLHIAPNQITITHGVSDISKRLGLFQSGELRFGNSTEPGFGFTGLRIGYPPFTYNGVEYVMAGVVDDALVFGLPLTSPYVNTIVWDDLRFEPVVRGTGSKNPSFVSWLNGLFLYDFDNALVAAEKEVWFNVQMPHGWKEGSAVYPHVHWTNRATGTAGHVCRWGLEYTKAKIGATFPATTTVYAATIAGGGDITVANEHMLSSFPSIDMTGDTVSTVLVCRMFRNSSDAADTYTGTAGLLYVDWHVQLDAFGSRNELSK